MNTTSTSRQSLTCKRCGEQNVHWATRANGSYYLAVVLPATADFPHKTAIKRPHVCRSQESLDREAADAAESRRLILAEMLAETTDESRREAIRQEMARC